MSDVLIDIGAVALFVVGIAYLVSTARVLARSGDIDEPASDDADEQMPSRAEPEPSPHPHPDAEHEAHRVP
jgi:hypothetical protein